MKNKKITRKITQGVYVLTTEGGGCIVDAVSQVSSGENPYISVAIMKENHTCDLIKNNEFFSLSVLDETVNPDIIKIFGYNSMRDIDKFDSIGVVEVQGQKIIEDSLGYMICKVVDRIDTGSHILIIGELIGADVFKDGLPMSYSYYQSHKENYVEIKTEGGKTAWICTVCGYVYYGEEIPADFKCPQCSVGKEYFEGKEN